MIDQTTLTLSLLIFILPLVAYTILALTHNHLPRHGDWLGIGAMGACLAMALVIFVRTSHWDSPLLANLTFPWLPAASGATIIGGVMVDRLTAVMLVVVTLISFLVHLFSTKYLEGDVRYGRYYCGLLLFTTSMLGLVLANNLLYLYMFWEMVGLSSYLLIGHWFEKKSASNAAIKAFITTRVGDVGMLIGLLICYRQVGSLQYADVFAAVDSGMLAGNWRLIAGLGLFLGAMGKSAQFPLHVWLPDAMEGPTPVSALIHAATMVAAGVYLTGRLLPVFDPHTLLFIAYVGGFTALFAASIALVQDDIKKVLAYSTVSQLGYMILALGVGGYSAGLFHLTTHAFFKGGLFLGSGAVIYAMHHEQSMRKYGGLFRRMPVTATCYLLCTLALVGFPGFSGFWSKDSILADTLAFSMTHGHWFLCFAGFATVFLTAFYMFRQYLLTFTGKPRDHHAYEHAHEVSWPMLLPLIILGGLALFAGGLHGEWFAEMNPRLSAAEQVENFKKAGYEIQASAQTEPVVAETTDGLAPAVVIHETGEVGAGSEGEGEAHALHRAHSIAMGLSTILGLSGILLGFLMYWERRDGGTLISPVRLAARTKPVYLLLLNKYYVDEFYDWLFVRTTLTLGWFWGRFDRVVIDSVVNFFGLLTRFLAFVVELLDRLFVDGMFVMGIARLMRALGEGLSLSETGRIRQYLTMTVVGIILISGFCIWLF